MMRSDWESRLLQASRRSNEREEREFLELVDEVKDGCTIHVARVLMKTFSEQHDYGTQERVRSVLAGADEGDITAALLEELPRLVRDAPRWVEALIGEEVEFRPELLARVASRMPTEIKQALREVLSNSDFQEFYPGAREVKF